MTPLWWKHPGTSSSDFCLQSLGLRVVGVRVDADGLVVDEIPPEARLVYVTPSHQFPLGMPMTETRRRALLTWAETHNAAIIEDDYDSEFRFGSGTVDPLHCIDRNGRVIYVGSFSKTMLPGLRLGFMIAPNSLLKALRTAKFVSDWHAPEPTQAALAEFIDAGMFARHIRTMRRTYQERHRLVTEVLRREYKDVLTPVDSAVGLHVAAFSPKHTMRQIHDVVGRAVEADIGIYALSGSGFDQEHPAGLIIGYGGIEAEDIEDGLMRLRDLME